ncbi:MAG: helix-turn-helix transcriptional regulator [Eubacterium sp.]|nr:helix-turn-helix transcriptional regulator [Eubacterium sp.]
MENNLYLYPNIAKVRKKCMTQAELAKLIGISQQEISRYEKGETKAPINYIIDLANCCKTSVDYILGREEMDLPEDEKQIISLYRDLSPENKARAEERLKALLDMQNN